MTLTINHAKLNNKYIAVTQDKFSTVYKVFVCPLYNDSRAGYPIDSRTYSTKERAMRRFHDLIRKENVIC